MKLDQYVTLGRSGLKVSPVCLGTMTFGTEWGWGADEAACRALFDRFVEAGGNFVDTADAYTGGKSEEMVGRFLRDRGLRDRVALATKFSFNSRPGDPNAGGNGRKNVYRALEASLRRLGTDYVDLYWLHVWDRVTPVEEVLSTLTDLVHSGKVRYLGLSDVPAWYASRFQTLAERQGGERAIALQLEYSLVERAIENEHIPMARALGLGLVPWSVLASGFLSGKYQRHGHEGRPQGDGRLQVTTGSGNPVFEKFNDKNWQILDALKAVANELGRSPAEVALAWVVGQPGVTSTLLGATNSEQLDANLRALDLTIPPGLRARLDEMSRPPATTPYVFFGGKLQEMVNGDTAVRAWSPGD